MNVFSIKGRHMMTVDNPPEGGSGEVESPEEAGPAEDAKETDTRLDDILDAIAAIAEKVTALSARMDAFVDAGAVVRETDDENAGDDDDDDDEEDLETAIEDMDFSLDDDADRE